MVDVIVIGAGHAGCEAAYACAKAKLNTKLITISKEHIALMPCNPSIGGPAKGIVVREIEALGGIMGKIADKTALQFKMLNKSKGPGVWSLRVQSDKNAYSHLMRETLESLETLEILEGIVNDLYIDNQEIKGVYFNQELILAKVVIITAGTYLRSKIMISDEVKYSGPDDLATSFGISECLKNHGIEVFRLKTGTPPRIMTSSVDLTKAMIQPGDNEIETFSWFSSKTDLVKEQLPCYLIYTNQKTHEIILNNLEKSSMYSGVVEGVGARYCPSIEDKLVRFSDKERHQLFLEPETKEFDTIYLQGMSSSLPKDVQEQFVKTLPGLENCKILKYAYAIEYDAFNPLQLFSTLESRIIKNLFLAGQINGTSGYEEAAGQGLIAGINAISKLKGLNPLILRRDEAYIGVMIDDLVTKGTKEPYRLLTSRSEFRLLTRHDNSYKRLCEYARYYQLISDADYCFIQKRLKLIDNLIDYTKQVYINSSMVSLSNYMLKNQHENYLGLTLYDFIKRPNVCLKDIMLLMDYVVEDSFIYELAEIEIKYAGYIEKAKRDALKLEQLENIKIPVDFDYSSVNHLALEARSKLELIRPMTIGQAQRISGVNPADITMLLMSLKKQK